MPITGEDEMTEHTPPSLPPASSHLLQQPQQTSVSKAELRRSNKPIMEKRRRARINHCLNDLKTLILEAMKKDPARHSKLEKADILEMTVKHLQNVQRQQLAVAVATDPTVLQKFKSGFSECASEVSRYISRIDGVDVAVRQRLLAHLTQCVSGLQQLTPLSFGAVAAPAAPGLGCGYPLTSPMTPFVSSVSPITPSTVMQQVPFSSSGDVNNNHSRFLSSLQLVPSRLPSGELALVVPSSAAASATPFFTAAAAAVATAAATCPGYGYASSDLSSPPIKSAFATVKRANSTVTSSEQEQTSSDGDDNGDPAPPPPSALAVDYSSTSSRNGREFSVTFSSIKRPLDVDKDEDDSGVISVGGWMRKEPKLVSFSVDGTCNNPRVVKVKPLRPPPPSTTAPQASTSATKDMWRPW